MPAFYRMALAAPARLGGEVQVMFALPANVLTQIKSGRLRDRSPLRSCGS